MVDAILALNSGVNERGELTHDTQARVNAAVELAAIHPSARLVMVGHGAEGMRDYATAQHPEAADALLEDTSLDTIESAHYTKRDLLEPNGWRRVIVGTSDYHAPRAGWTFSRILGPQYTVGIHAVPSAHPEQRMRWIRHRERAQLAVARLKLVGLAPDDDQARQRRLERLRFRERGNPMARMLERADHLTQVKRD